MIGQSQAKNEAVDQEGDVQGDWALVATPWTFWTLSRAFSPVAGTYRAMSHKDSKGATETVSSQRG